MSDEIIRKIAVIFVVDVVGYSRHMEVNENGIGLRDYIDEVIVMDEIIGRGIIVHGGEDDLESQPSGASGPRVGCGVIGIQK